MSGISAQYVDGLEFRIKELGEQVSKLTKERDELKTVPMKYRRMQFNAELQDEVTQLQKQLAALAAQNEKMREALAECEQALDECRDYPVTLDLVIEALSLPDLMPSALKSDQYSGCITPKLHEVIEELQANPPKREDVDALLHEFFRLDKILKIYR